MRISFAVCLPLVVALFAALPARSPAAEVDKTPLKLEVERAFPNLAFQRPILLTHAGDGSQRLFVPSQLGKIFVFPNDQDVAEEKVKLFLDIEEHVEYKDKENEKGFLGLAFHPKYKSNGQFFVFYCPKGTNTTRISRFTVSKSDPDKADPKSEQVLMSVDHPYWNHKGGTIEFGPDGFLYITLGDGGLANDPHGHGQSLKTLLGKILRIDVDSKSDGKPYGIPKDNPFANQKDALPEIWAYGLRNVWRFSFDRETGTLWAADVGQDLWEEINLITRGGNYGWRRREGMHPFVPKQGKPEANKDSREGVIDPIFEYDHVVGKSITGGSVYRGKKFPELAGKYVYADYVTNKIWALAYDAKSSTVTGNHPIKNKNISIMSFGEDANGEIYFTDTGKLFRFKMGE